ncbi:hypothetical protein L3X38_023912 [Prunus dulcis]|uniref:Uncharacterized protein n=1 Tax=Prunus dulcis TaxID=3755 RepID=A0AAD4VYU5_PRUDU|nr:hypothetical protein L3X38_023912 [Prunus dulcis]
MAEEMVVCDGVRRLGLPVRCDGSVSEIGSGLQRWVVLWGSVICRDGLCDGFVSKGMGCAVEFVVNLMGCAMGCVCKMREFSMGWGLISDGVGFDIT